MSLLQCHLITASSRQFGLFVSTILLYTMVCNLLQFQDYFCTASCKDQFPGHFHTSCYIRNFHAIFARVATNPDFQVVLALVGVNILYQLTEKLPRNYEKSQIKPNTFKLLITVDSEADVCMSVETHLSCTTFV